MSLDLHEEPRRYPNAYYAIFISLELSRLEMADHFAGPWRRTGGCPSTGSRRETRAGLLARFWVIRDKVLARTGKSYPIVVIQEAGLDGFWIHRSLVKEGIESHVVDAASIAVSRRRRRAKTDKIDGEGLLRALLVSAAARAAGVLDGAGSHAGGRGPPPDLSRAQDADRRADTACQSDQRPAVFSGDRRLRAAAPGSTPSAGGGSHGRRACAGREHEGANRTRAGSARIAARPDRGDRGRTRRDVGEAGRGRGGSRAPVARPRACRSRWT